MKRLRNIVALAALVMIAIAATHLNFSNLSWEVNATSYKSMIAMACTFFTMVSCNRIEARKRRAVQE